MYIEKVVYLLLEWITNRFIVIGIFSKRSVFFGQEFCTWTEDVFTPDPVLSLPFKISIGITVI
jgi:hypothetical protein